MQKNASDIFGRSTDGNQIFSINGSPSIRINRRRNDASSVYPYGGDYPAAAKQAPPGDLSAEHYYAQQPQEPLEYEEPPPDSGREQDGDFQMQTLDVVDERPEIAEEEAAGPKQPQLQQPQHPQHPQQNYMTRNILTGEGVEAPSGRVGKRRGRKPKSLWTW